MGDTLRALVAWAATVWILGSSAPAAAIVNGQPPAADDRRFDAVGAWSRARWLGLGEQPQHEHNWFGGAVLVRANLVVTAKHLCENPEVPSGTYAVRFRRRIDGGLGSREQGVFSYHHVLVDRIEHGPGDLALAYLAEPVTHIEPVPVMQMGFLGLDGAPYTSAGWGREGPEMEAGPRNQLLLCAENRLRRVALRSVSYPGFNSRPEPPCKVNEWDSGGAVFVEEQDRLWLLATHHTFNGGPTFYPWLQQQPPQLLHTPFTQPDLALEALEWEGRRDVLRGERQRVELLLSNPGPQRRGAERGEVVIELTSVGQDVVTEVHRASLPRNLRARQLRTESLSFALPEDLPVGLYRLSARLDGMGEADLTRNNRLELDDVITVRSRPQPFRRLGVGAAVRVQGGGQVQIVNVLAIERSHGRQGVYAFGDWMGGAEHFAQLVRDLPAGQTEIETPWGLFAIDLSQASLTPPQGFEGQLFVGDEGDYSPFSGLYEAMLPGGDHVIVGLTATGLLSGAVMREGDVELVSVRFQDGALRAVAAEGFSAFQAVELVWDEATDTPQLVFIYEEDERSAVVREEEPVAPYGACADVAPCRAYAGDESSRCYRALGQAVGVCVPGACEADPGRCGDPGVCLEALGHCVPVCEAGDACPLAMTCTAASLCIDCEQNPSLCQVPDAGATADAGVAVDGSAADGSSRGRDDAGSGGGDAALVDAGLDPAVPQAGCSCGAAAGLECAGLLLLGGLVRRRRSR